jgi:hypothetical protein
MQSGSVCGRPSRTDHQASLLQIALGVNASLAVGGSEAG